MNNEIATHPNWPLLWIAVAAFVAMGATIATQAVPPPTPESVSPTVSILILALLFIFIGTFTAFLWEVLSVDSRTSVDTPHVPSPVAPKQNIKGV